MSDLDLYYADDDAHRVRPLIRFLDLQDVALCPQTEPSSEPSKPSLVILSESYVHNPWLAEQLAKSGAIAVRVSDEPVPAGTDFIDVRAWPARSADRVLLALANWVRSPEGSPPPVQRAAAPTSAGKQQNLVAILSFAAVFAGLLWLAGNTEGEQQDDEVARTDRQVFTEIAGAEIAEADTAGATPFETRAQLTNAALAASAVALRSSARAGSLQTAAQSRRTTCLRRWQLGGRAEQCWVAASGAFSPVPAR